jgi:arylformamidase
MSDPRTAIYDISPLLHAGIPVWPGDPLFSLEKIASISDGAAAEVAALSMGLHTGAHVDAPAHYEALGKTIDQLDLSCFVGPVRLVTVSEEAISVSHLRKLLEKWPERLIIRSAVSALASHAYFQYEAAELLGRNGVRLVGTDAASVDHPASEDLAAHKAFGRFGIPILEGLSLDAVPDGEYELIALPLRILGADASPVRAVLRPAP